MNASITAAARPLRVGLVGCGRLAELGHVPAAAELDELEFVAVADPVSERAELIAARIGAPEVRVYASSTALIAAGDLEALVIASPADDHLATAELAAAAGLPCLVEKPPAPDLERAQRIAALDPAPWIGFNRRFQHAAALLDQVPAEGPLELELELRARRASWRAHTVADDALLDLGPHLIDLALLLSGSTEAEVVRASLGSERAELELETARGRALIRCATDRPHRERIVARGAGGRRLATSADGGPLRAVIGRLPGREHPLVTSLRAQLATFAAAARGADPGLLASAADGVHVMRVIEAARAAAPQAAVAVGAGQ